MTVVPRGSVAPGFEPLAEVFAANFAARGEAGAAFVASHPVVGLWGGEARPGVPWEPDPMAEVFSTTKGPRTLTIGALAGSGAHRGFSPGGRVT
ncbi:MAG: hypothetical protein ABIJ48_07975 [Actinomycetota bacterium]